MIDRDLERIARVAIRKKEFETFVAQFINNNAFDKVT
jgi:hypothetical protein